LQKKFDWRSVSFMKTENKIFCSYRSAKLLEELETLEPNCSVPNGKVQSLPGGDVASVEIKDEECCVQRF
jgi:hypothetical protein